MKQYRVEVKDFHEANEAQDLFEKLGYKKGACFKDNFPKLIITDEDGYSCGALTHYRGGEPITLDQLRTMAKKEYLNANYELITVSREHPVCADWIEVPEGAEISTRYNDFLIFWKENIWSFSKKDGDTEFVSGGDNMPLSEYLEHYKDGVEIVWQRTPSVDKSKWDIQVGGDHYKNMKIQPAKFALENKLDYCQANAIKYICRHESKNGKQDLEKAKHYIDLLIEHYYG